MSDHEVRAGSLSELQSAGQLLTKVGTLPVVVFWSDDTAFAIEDRCPHLGFPLHQGTVEAGLVTCHWHHARFDLVSGCTLDLWADDARGFDVDVRGDDVFVHSRVHADPVGHLQTRLRNGLEDDISLVVAKSVLGLLDAGVPASEIVRTGMEFGTRYRSSGWGAGLTVLVAMANLLPQLDPDDRALALVHGLTFVARDTVNHAPRFAVGALETQDVPVDRLADWYRRFVDTRSSRRGRAHARDRARRAGPAGRRRDDDVRGGHRPRVHRRRPHDRLHEQGVRSASITSARTRPARSCRRSCARPRPPPRSEEFGEWRHPHNHAALARRTIEALPDALAEGLPRRGEFSDVGALGWQLLDDDPEVVAAALLDALRAGADEEELGRAIAYAAALRILRFHIQNDHGDWDTVHHAFTAANGLHQALQRRPSPELLRGAVHAALRINLDRFLNVPGGTPARERRPAASTRSAHCFDVQGMVDEAGNEAYGFLHGGGTRAELVAALAHGLLAEDAEFHWYQVLEAGVRQSQQWPEGSEEVGARPDGSHSFPRPRTHRRGASCRRSCASQPGCGAAKRSTKTRTRTRSTRRRRRVRS